MDNKIYSAVSDGGQLSELICGNELSVQENIDETIELSLDWENTFSAGLYEDDTHIDSISDGLIMSLSNLARVDIEYISSVTGEDMKDIICALKGAIFQNPDSWEGCFYKGWETAEEYLSGNLLRKLRAARKANEEHKGYFEDNIKALEKAMPDKLSCKDIYITLGSPWVPVDIIDEFVGHIFNLRYDNYSGTKHDEITGTWELGNKDAYIFKYSIEAIHTYGTHRIQALTILERTLNMKAITITDEVDSAESSTGKKRVINQEETILALEKQQKMIKEFQNWVWRDPYRKNILEKIYENNYSCVRRRIFNGSFLQFPGMSCDISLYPYQKNAVARILFSPNTLLAHDVGSGKTYVMIAAGMELKRMGISQKNLYVVPNNLIGQWKSIFEKLYPDARILCVEPKSFTPTKRNDVLTKIRDEDYDGIIMAYSCFERIPLSPDFYRNKILNEGVQVRDNLNNSRKNTAKLKKKYNDLNKEFVKLISESEQNESSIYFDKLGITRLFVDEAHNYKNVPIETKTDRVLGINTSGSKKCFDMMNKVQLIQKQNNGGGVVMATGTPITNSITDAYIMQKYLQGGELELLNLQSFDSWIGMFAERATEFEIDVDTSNYRLATRFSKFHNLPELTSLLASVADFHRVDVNDGIPAFDGYDDALIPKTLEFSAYLDNISGRAELVRSGKIKRTADNMLKITTDGRKAALDMRLVEPSSPFTYRSKAFRCAENVYKIYCRTADKACTQLIFCDSSVPKKEFNMYDEIRRLLIGMGVPAGEIAFVHDAETEARRSALFAKVRRGEIRILLGSTFKLGLGVNVQDKLIALHHLDVPWRPADMTQREGRILRQGNGNENVQIYRYITEGSFDAYSWQLLETKQRFISALLSGSLTERSSADIEGTVLDYAEVKALAIGNPLIKHRVEKANELSRCMALQLKVIETRLSLEKELNELPARIERQEDIIFRCESDIEFYFEAQREYEKDERREIRQKLHSAVMDNVLVTNETPLMNYQGFTIVLPANMVAEKPFVWLQKSGRYYVELGESDTGMLIRIDNYLDNLPSHLDKLREGLSLLCDKEKAIKAELKKKYDYADKIKLLKEELEKIDKELGVGQK